MRFAYSSNAYTQFSIEETIERIAGLGYAGLELLADVPHAWPAGLLPERKRAIRECLDRFGLEIANVNGFMMNAVADPRQPYWHPSWIEPDPDYRAIRREHTKRALHLAAELGAPSIQTEPGGPLREGESWAAAAEVFYRELMPCVEVAEKQEVFLLIEPEPGLLDRTVRAVPGICRPGGLAVAGAEFRHRPRLLCRRRPRRNGSPRMAPHTKHYHIEDIAANRRHAHLIPGRGAIDLGAALHEIEASGYDGWVTVELYPYVDNPDDAGREAKSFLEAALEDGR